MKKIDAHVFFGEGIHLASTESELLENMDNAEIEKSMVCSVDRYLTTKNFEGNNALIKLSKRYPGRFITMASVNPWFESEAVAELERALAEGMNGVFFHSGYQGFRLNDHLVDPLLEKAAEYKVPVYAHTGIPIIAEPFQLLELARRFPEMNFIMGHAGASDYYADAVRSLEFADNIWLESSRNGPANYQLFERCNCIDKLIFGSSFPEYNPSVEAKILTDSIENKTILDDIFYNNIQKLISGAK